MGGVPLNRVGKAGQTLGTDNGDDRSATLIGAIGSPAVQAAEPEALCKVGTDCQL